MFLHARVADLSGEFVKSGICLAYKILEAQKRGELGAVDIVIYERDLVSPIILNRIDASTLFALKGKLLYKPRCTLNDVNILL